MRAHGKTFLLLALTLGFSGCEKQSSQYLALGDSYTCGQSVDPSARWPVQLAARLKQNGASVGTPIIIAETGWTTSDLSQAMSASEPKGPFKLVTLLIGVNNQFRGRSTDEYRSQFVELLKRSIALTNGRASHVVVLSIPDWGVTPYAQGEDRGAIARSIDAFNDINRDESKRLHVRYVDITGESRRAATQPALLADDGLHPSSIMYGEWVDAAFADMLAAVEDR